MERVLGLEVKNITTNEDARWRENRKRNPSYGGEGLALGEPVFKVINSIAAYGEMWIEGVEHLNAISRRCTDVFNKMDMDDSLPIDPEKGW